MKIIDSLILSPSIYNPQLFSTTYNHHSLFSLNSKFPKPLSESCAIGGALYAKRKGANLAIGSYNRLPPPFHKEGERGWIVNIIGGIKPTLKAEDLGSAKLRSEHLLTPIIYSTHNSHSNKKKPNPKDSA